MSSSYSSLDWVSSHWDHFTVHRLIYLCLSVCILCVFVSYCIVVVLLWARWGGPDRIQAWSLGLIFLWCFDTVGWVILPVKPVPDMTYNVFDGTLNLARSVYLWKSWLRVRSVSMAVLQQWINSEYAARYALFSSAARPAHSPLIKND